MDLNNAQKEAVSHGEGPCLILAGPGSGKTHTIAKRIEYLIQEMKVRPEEILVLTFTKYAAAEMRQRFYRVMASEGGPAKPPVVFGTFHSIFYSVLRSAYSVNIDSILSDHQKIELLSAIAEKSDKQEIRALTDEEDSLKDLADLIGRMKNNGEKPEKNRQERDMSVLLEQAKEVYPQYEEYKKVHKKIDFEDMLILSRDFFLKNPEWLKNWQQRFAHILVDEFQDLNLVQYELLRMVGYPQNNLFVVGDDDQSIYAFRGATPAILRRFAEDFKSVHTVTLDVNYRCSQLISSRSSALISHNKERFSKVIHAVRESEREIQIVGASGALAESRFILALLQRWQKEGVPAEEIGILYRTADDARCLMDTLDEYGVDFVSKDRSPGIYNHYICRDLEAYFKLALGEGGRKELLRIANRPNRYLSRDSLSDPNVNFEGLRAFYQDKDWMQERLYEMEEDIIFLEKQTSYAAIQYIRSHIGYDTFLEEYCKYKKIPWDRERAVLDELQERAKSAPSIRAWTEHITAIREESEEAERSDGEKIGVHLMTMHGSKGLEFEKVCILHANEGIIPHEKAKTVQETEEERRLFYVAVTRAKDELIVSYLSETDKKEKIPSRFLEELYPNWDK